ncbi:MAG: hypothetical protein IE925_16915 [Rhodobacterales bacterium]|nr:hypothetical protein [Rhodobacterales bacterium]
MSRTITLAGIQFTPSDDMQANIDRVAGFVREAAAQGADVVLPPELFCGYYFCKTQEEHHFERALPWPVHPAVVQLSELAAELGVVIPVSIYEKDGPHYYNSLVMIDADGTPLGVYRKSHIPDGPGYHGTSFITDHVGEVVTDFGRSEEGILLASFDLDVIDRDRAAWGFFRDRRTDLYDILV